MNKICTRCKTEKSLEDFYSDKKAKDGHTHDCKNCRNTANRGWYADNLERAKNSAKLRDEKRRAKPEAKIKKIAYINNRRKTDMNFRLRHNLRERVRQAVAKSYKSSSTMDLLGCSTAVLREHLANNFQDGMTWENYGLWHIDHILPCASFDLTKEAEQKKCFNFSNLQPLWAEDNLKKGDKILCR